MLKNIRHCLSVGLYCAKLSLQGQMEYPLFLVSWIIMVPLQWFAGIYMLNLLVHRFHELQGWGFPQLAFLYGLSVISHGLMVTFFIRTWHMESLIIHGEYDRMFLRPLGIFFQMTVQYVNLIGVIDTIPGLIIFIYGCRKANHEFTFKNILLILMVLIGALLIRTAFYALIGTISFWTTKNYSLIDMGIKLMQYGTTYPLSIYPYLVQVILTFLLPIGFISFYPASEFLEMPGSFTFPFRQSFVTLIIGIVFFAASQVFFKIGLRSYESTGS